MTTATEKNLALAEIMVQETTAAYLAGALDTLPVIGSVMDAATDAGKLRRLALRHHRLQENDCNRGLDYNEKRQEEYTERKVTEILAKYGIKPNFSGDPRGLTVKFFTPHSKRSNTWGGTQEGWGVEP